MPNSNKPYNVIVIGSGPAGYVAAIRAAQLGLKTAIVERDRLGGICLNWGCIPTKALLETAHLLDSMKNASKYGLKCENPAPDWDAIVKRSRGVSEQMSNGVNFLMKKNKIEIITGTASLDSANVINVNDGRVNTKYETEHIIIATGARPRELTGLKFDSQKIISYREAMVLPQIPKKLLVIGAGAIGVEFSWFYNVMGSEVTLVEMMDNIVPLEDRDISMVLAKSFRERGITFKPATKVTGVNHLKKHSEFSWESDGEKGVIEADVCLSATGVVPNTEGLNLEKIGVQIERGFVKVNGFMQSSIPNVYAIGDIAGAPMLAHKGSHDGITAAETIAGINPSPINHNNVPSCTYCYPQIASVGMTEEVAKAKGIAYKTGKYYFRSNGRAVGAGETTGLVKFITEVKHNEILGVHIIGAGATELIAEVVLARELELTTREIATTIHAHPTFSEAVMEAAADSLGMAIHL